MLRVGIPAYGLPRDVVEREIERIKKAGVEARLNSPMGKDVLTLDSLMQQGYHAVFIATGAHKGLPLGVPGEDLAGIVSGTSLPRELGGPLFLTRKAIIGKNNGQRAIRSMAANRISKKAIRRESIIQAAIEVFGKKGFQAATISEIAQRAGVAEGSIYQYFKNKEDLFFSIPIEKTKEFRTQLELHLEGIFGAFNKILKFVWYFLYFFTVNPEYGRMLMLEMRVSKSFVKTDTYDFLKKSVGHVLEIILEGQEEGVIRKDTDVYILRHLVLGILEHIVSRWLLKGGKYDLLEHHQEVSRLVIDALRNPVCLKDFHGHVPEGAVETDVHS